MCYVDKHECQKQTESRAMLEDDDSIELKYYIPDYTNLIGHFWRVTLIRRSKPHCYFTLSDVSRQVLEIPEYGTLRKPNKNDYT